MPEQPVTEQRYDIFFRGEALEGFAIETVKANVAQLFKASPEKTEQLFSGKVVPLRKDLDKATAAKFKQALDKAGAKIYIKLAAETAPAPAPAAPATVAPAAPAARATPAAPSPSPAPAPTTRPTPTAAGAFVILPPGSDVLRPEERPVVEAVKVDISGIRMASVFDQPEVDTTPPPPPPKTSHLSTAPVGADILEGVKKEAPPPPPDVSYISVAAPGADMSEGVEKIPAASAPDVSHISTAPVGADILEGVKKETPPPAPDISHISLAN